LIDKLVSLADVNSQDVNDLREQITSCCSNLPGILSSISDLQGLLEDEVSNRASGDAAEAAARESADVAEAAARESADQAEANARSDGDADLGSQVSGVVDDLTQTAGKLQALINESDRNHRLSVLRGYL
jgi:hypothetical protein